MNTIYVSSKRTNEPMKFELGLFLSSLLRRHVAHSKALHLKCFKAMLHSMLAEKPLSRAYYTKTCLKCLFKLGLAGRQQQRRAQKVNEAMMARLSDRTTKTISRTKEQTSKQTCNLYRSCLLALLYHGARQLRTINFFNALSGTILTFGE